MNVPDCVSPIVAYRGWGWDIRGLTSFNGEFWPPNQSMQANCRQFHHNAPPDHGDCTCGIYAAKSLDQLRMMGYADQGVYGEVYLWGTVVEHEFGWRAQFAYPKTFVLSPKTLVLSRESLLFGGYIQRELSMRDAVPHLRTLTAYGADIFVTDEKKKIPLWTKDSEFDTAGLDWLRRVCAEGIAVGVRIAILMEWQDQQTLEQNGLAVSDTVGINFTEMRFPLNPLDPIVRQIQDSRARMVVIDTGDESYERFQYGARVIEIIRRIAGPIAIFVTGDQDNDNLRSFDLRSFFKWHRCAKKAGADGFLDRNGRNDIMDAFRGTRTWPSEKADGSSTPPPWESDGGSTPPMAPLPQSRWKLLAAPIGPSEVRRTERWLAAARVSLAVCTLFAVWMYSTQISWWAHWLLGIYVIHSTVVMLLFRLRKQSTPPFRALVHAADLILPALIYVFATGRDLFFLFFVFVLAAAAYRWGLWETVATAAGSCSSPCGEDPA